MGFFDIFNKKGGMSEGLQSDTPYLSLEMDEKELVGRIDKSIASGRPLYEDTKKRSERNRKYYLGDQLDLSKLKDYQAKTVTNLIFRDMETMIPIITKETPIPTFISSNKEFDRSMEKALVSRWEVHDEMLDKGRKAVRANFLDLLGVLKYKWDDEYNCPHWEYVKTRNIIVDENCTSDDDCQFLAEFITDQTLGQVIEKYPKKKDELWKEHGIREGNDEKLGHKFTYVEFWTPEFVAWKSGSIVLDKFKNPNWDWGQETTDESGEKQTKSYNVFKKPKVPYIFFQTFNLGEKIYSDTSFIEQTIALQDGYNKRKRQISDNADEANGVLVGSGDVISKDEFAKVDDRPKTKIWVESGDPTRGIARIPGNPLQGYVFNDMIHSEQSIDGLWGIHAITQGANSGADTATQDVLQQKQDFGRIDDIVKAYEDFNEQYYQATFQLILVHGYDPQTYSFVDEDDLEISRKDIIAAYSKTVKRKLNQATGKMETIEEPTDFRPPIIMVKRGSTLPTDEVSRRAEALELAKVGKISTMDLYDQLGWPNSRELAKNAFLEMAAPDQLYPELAEGGEGEMTEGAVEDFTRIMQGLQTPPSPEIENPETAGPHMESHNQQLDSQEFQAAEPALQQAFLAHVQEEMALAKEILGGGASQPPQVPAPQQEPKPMAPPA